MKKIAIGLVLLLPLSSVAFGMLMLTLASATPAGDRLATPAKPLSKTSWQTPPP